MRITGWHIDAFGALQDHQISGLSPGLNVIYGANEAGKSTLLAFIRGVLFRFPDGRSKENTYEPRSGLKRRGRLFLEAEDGAWTVERSSGRPALAIKRPDGKEGQPSDLARLVGGVDGAVFSSIFAFSTLELDALDAFQADAVAERIFAALHTGAGRSPLQAAGALGDLRAELLRPRGSARINNLKKQLSDIEAALATARAHALRYGDLARELHQTQDRRDELNRHIADLAKRHRDHEVLVELWPSWTRMATARSELDRLAASGVAGEDQARLASLHERSLSTRALLADRREGLEAIQAQIETVVVDDALVGLAPAIKTCHALASAYEANLARLEPARRDVAELERSLGEDLALAGPGWTADRIATLDVSLTAVAEALGWEERLAQARDRVSHAQARVQEHTSRIQAGAADVAGLAERIDALGTPPDAEEIEAALAHLSSARALLGEVTDLKAELRIDQLAIAQRAAAMAGRGYGSMQRALYVLAGLCILAAAAMTLGGRMYAAGSLGLAGVGIGAIAVFFRPPRTTSPPGEGEEPPGGGATAARLSACQARLASASEGLAIPNPPTTHDLEAQATRLARAQNKRESLDELTRAHTYAAAEQESLASDLRLASAELDAAREDCARSEAEWAGWAAARGLPADLRPAVGADVLTVLRRAGDSANRLGHSRAGLGALESDIGAFADEVSELARQAGRGGDARSPAATIRSLFALVTSDEAARAKLEKLQADRRAVQKQLARSEAELAAILGEAGVATAADLDSLAAAASRAAVLAHEANEAEHHIASRLGTTGRSEELAAELAKGDMPAWQAALDQLTVHVRELSAEREAVIHKGGELQAAMAALADSHEVADLELLAEGVRSEIAQAAAQWAKLALAEALIRETLGRFERERQPYVVKRSSELFAQITAGRYESVIATNKTLEVCDRHGQFIPASALSRGTAHQLYLCVRFGLAEELARRATSLPLVMDEVLVHFDPVRAGALAKVVADVSRNHQLLVFTCHPETVRLLSAAAPTLEVINL